MHPCLNPCWPTFCTKSSHNCLILYFSVKEELPQPMPSVGIIIGSPYMCCAIFEFYRACFFVVPCMCCAIFELYHACFFVVLCMCCAIFEFYHVCFSQHIYGTTKKQA
jgi:hypothetical protein